MIRAFLRLFRPKLAHRLHSRPAISTYQRSIPRIALVSLGTFGLSLGSYYYYFCPRFIDHVECKSSSGAINNNYYPQLFSSVVNGDLKRVKLLLSNSQDVNVLHPEGGWSLLHVACLNGHYDIVKFLLDNGADINAQQQKPPAFGGKGYNRLESLVTIVEREYWPRFNYSLKAVMAVMGATPLHCAVLGGNEKILRLLIDNGADPRILTQSGKSPLDFYDPRHDSKAVVDMLKQAAETIVIREKQREKEMRRKHPLEQHLKKYIVGQDTPVNCVSSAIRRKQNGWYDEGRPLVFLFLGSSGIGKTELAKQLAKYVHKDDENAFIRIDMSEFQSKHEVAKFIGSPPGYVGYQEGGQLTSRLKKNPNAVVLLDEVEKAHIDVLTIMLQVFDEGRLTDGQGNTVDCKDAIFIMTSNLAQQEIAQEADALRKEVANQNGHNSGRVIAKEFKSLSKSFIDETVYPILRDHFRRDEFLGRINEILFFLPFTQKELELIAEKELGKWKERAQSRHNITLTWDPKVLSVLSTGYNIHYGARSIKYEVEKRIVNRIAKAHEMDEICDGSQIHLYVDETNEELAESINMKFTTSPQPSKSILPKLW